MQAGDGIDVAGFFAADEGLGVVAAQHGVFAFEAGAAIGGFFRAAGQCLDVSAEDGDVGVFCRAQVRTVPPYAPAELDERAHGGGFDNGPIVIVVAADFGYGGAKDDEDVVLGGALG